MNNSAVTAKYILRLQFETTAPLLIGGGNDDSCDLNIVRLSDGQPFIPGSSIAGRLMRCFKENQNSVSVEDLDFMRFWGIDASDENRHQSLLNVGPALLRENHSYNTTIYDSVRIDVTTANAAPQGKYNYEYLNPGAKFQQEIVVTERDGCASAIIARLTHFIITCFKNDLSFGAKAKLGFGTVKLKESTLVEFRFPKDFDDWMTYCHKGTLPEPKLRIYDQIEYKATEKFSLIIRGKLAGPIITSLKVDDKGGSDRIQFHRKDEKIIPASSLMGPLSHRAKKILNTVLSEQADKLYKNLFGDVDEQNKEAIKSRIKVKESKLSNVKDHTQTRNKIDRFTGGTIPGALMQTQPVTAIGKKYNLEVNIEIKEPLHNEITLMMHIAKDLLSGDLAIGGEKGIGRGVLDGGELTAVLNDEEAKFTVTRDGGKVDIQKATFLEQYTSFNESDK